MNHIRLHFITAGLLFLLLSCNKEQFCQIPPELPTTPTKVDPVTVRGFYNSQSCRTYFDARLLPTGLLLHDDTTEPEDCDSESLPFHIQPFIFPLNDTIYRGLRITGPYPFRKVGFKLFTATHPEFHRKATFLYTYAVPGKYVLQVFFPEADWQDLLSTDEQLEFSFQVIPEKNMPPTFTILQGYYEMEEDRLYLTENADEQAASYTIHANNPELQFQLIDPPLGVGSVYVLRIRSIYTLPTEDFVIWTENNTCNTLQNWDLQLIPAVGYHVMEVALDPPFMNCLKREQEAFQFRIALFK